MDGRFPTSCPSEPNPLPLSLPNPTQNINEINAPGYYPDDEQVAPSKETLPIELPPQLRDLFEMLLAFPKWMRPVIRKASIGVPIFDDNGELLDFDRVYDDDTLHHILHQHEIRNGRKLKKQDPRAGYFYANITDIMDPRNAALLKPDDHEALHHNPRDLEGYQRLLVERGLDLELFIIASLNIYFLFEDRNIETRNWIYKKFSYGAKETKIPPERLHSMIRTKAGTALHYIVQNHRNLYDTYISLRRERVRNPYDLYEQ